MKDLAEMTLTIRNIGGLKFSAQTRKHEVIFDQPQEEGGEDRGMTSVELFIASLGACIGTYIVWFCERYKIAHTHMRMIFHKIPHERGDFTVDRGPTPTRVL